MNEDFILDESCFAPEPSYDEMSQEELDEMISCHHRMYDELDFYDLMMQEDELPF